MTLKELIESKGYTVYAIAQRSRITSQTVYYLTGGVTRLDKMNVVVAYKLSKALDMSVDEFLKTLEVID